MNDPLPVFVKPTADEDVPEHVRHAPKDSSNGASDLTHDDMMHAASATHMLTKPMWDMKPFSAMLAVVGIILVVFFALFVDYADTPDDADNYQLFIHVCIMIFVGFGFLMTFLKRYSLAAVCLNYITVRASRAALHALAYQSSAHFVLTQGKSVFVVLEAILVFGAFEYADSSTNMRFIKLDIFLLVNALFAAGAGMITFGALIGKVSPLQILIILFLQVPLWAANVVFVFSRGFLLQGADDAGGAIAIHTFGAYYGIAATFVAFRNKPNLGAGHERNSANYTSNVTSLIGTIFLWILWPSFNGIFTGDARMVSFANTVISISGATLATFAIAPFLSESGRINVVMVQNATLAGGVAIGAVPDLKIGAGVVLLVGFGAGILSCVGFAKLGPFMERKLGVRDTCGVHSLHGMPGVYGGIVGVCALLALGSPAAATAEFGFLAVTIVIAVAGGGAAGFVSTLVDKVTSDDRHSVLAYEDHTVFEFDDV